MRLITHNVAQHRFECTEHGETCYIVYRPQANGTWLLAHTEAPSSPQGRSIAADIARAVLEHAQQHNIKIRTECPFVIGYLAFHPEFSDLEDA